MKTTSRILVCVLGAIFIFSSLGAVYAVDTETQIQSKEALLAYYIWVFLDSIGIEVTYQDILGYVDEMQDTIIDWVIEYIADEIEAEHFPSNYSISQWIAPWQAQYDYWGNLQFNSTMLEDLQDFADWLKRKFSLIDDDTLVVDPVYSVNGYTFYLYENYYPMVRLDNGQPSNEFSAVSIEVLEENNCIPIGYTIILWNNRPFRVNYVFPSGNNNITVKVKPWFLRYDGTQGSNLPNGGVLSLWSTNIHGYLTTKDEFFIDPSADNGAILIPDGSHWTTQNWDEVQLFLENSQIQQIGDIKIITYEIVLPNDNPDYIDGDGVTIIDGVPQYENITFSGIITNLPAVISTGTIPVPGDELNPGMVDAWRPISSLISVVSDSMAVVIGIIYEFPEEVIIPIYAVMGGLIIFGLIHAMKEH